MSQHGGTVRQGSGITSQDQTIPSISHNVQDGPPAGGPSGHERTDRIIDSSGSES